MSRETAIRAARAAIAPMLPGGHLRELPPGMDPITRIAEAAVVAAERDIRGALAAEIEAAGREHSYDLNPSHFSVGMQSGYANAARIVRGDT